MFRRLAGAALAAAALAAPMTAPAASAPPPRNDDRAAAEALPGVPSQTGGTTVGATLERRDPRDCGRLDSTVWYRLDNPAAARVVLRLKASDDLDALLAVYRRVRSELRFEGCRRTNDSGVAALAFDASRNSRYLILVGERQNSSSASFRLTATAGEPPPAPPGARLPRRGVRDSVNALGDTADAWAVRMAAGRTYRLNLVSYSGACLGLELFAPGTRSFENDEDIGSLDCEGYTTFTPGPDGGGLYSLLVTASDEESSPNRQPYRLQVAPAGPDDTAPGLALPNARTVRGHLAGLGLDVVDMYRFDVTTRSDVALTLHAKAAARFDLEVLHDDGRRVDCVCDETGTVRFRERLDPGRYYAVVEARTHAGGPYRLSLLVRQITTTSFEESASELRPGETVSLAAHVSTGLTGGRVEIQVDRFDPLAGWVFYRLFEVPVVDGAAEQTFRPPTLGRWRARASFLGTGGASPSRSTYVFFLVAHPLGTP